MTTLWNMTACGKLICHEIQTPDELKACLGEIHVACARLHLSKATSGLWQFVSDKKKQKKKNKTGKPRSAQTFCAQQRLCLVLGEALPALFFFCGLQKMRRILTYMTPRIRFARKWWWDRSLEALAESELYEEVKLSCASGNSWAARLGFSPAHT